MPEVSIPHTYSLYHPPSDSVIMQPLGLRVLALRTGSASIIRRYDRREIQEVLVPRATLESRFVPTNLLVEC